MKYLKWVAVVFLAGLLGVLFIQFLSVHPLQMSVYLFATCVVLFLLIVLLAVGFRRRALLIAVLLAVGVFLIGHYSMTKIILERDDPRSVPELTRKPGDPGLGHYGWQRQSSTHRWGDPSLCLLWRKFFADQLHHPWPSPSCIQPRAHDLNHTTDQPAY